ncbi:60S ribosomal protein L6 [Chytridium lagenaria]|nr:60S ribosomal protein L6 [Chytridium lagenaria]
MAPKVRNAVLMPGVSSLSRTQAYKAKGAFNKKKASPPAKVAGATTKVVKVGGNKNGGARNVSNPRPAHFYPAEDVPQRKVTRKVAKQAPLRSSITPGTVLILLAGRFAGKRVVFLKRLESGLLLVTGPFKINGVPLRRVNQAYVIATSTKVDVSACKISDKINDAYFKAGKAGKAKATEEALFDPQAKKAIDATRIADQKAVDAALLNAVKKVPLLKAYLNASFSLTKGQAPHLLKF